MIYNNNELSLWIERLKSGLYFIFKGYFYVITSYERFT